MNDRGNHANPSMYKYEYVVTRVHGRKLLKVDIIHIGARALFSAGGIETSWC